MRSDFPSGEVAKSVKETRVKWLREGGNIPSTVAFPFSLKKPSFSIHIGLLKATASLGAGGASCTAAILRSSASDSFSSAAAASASALRFPPPPPPPPPEGHLIAPSQDFSG